MSRESLDHLNTQTLIGFTDKRGTAWHYRAELQNDEPNHYPAAVPVDDVHRRLFHWTAESRRLAVETAADAASMTHLDPAGKPAAWTPLAAKQAICRSDAHDGSILGIFGPGYVRHQYSEWLVATVADLLDDDLSISSAGLLRGGAVAWVEVSVPENITTPEGVEFRPNLLATTSFDGSIATTFKRTVTDVVCDNTRELALAETGQQLKVKHSRHSQLKLGQAREALAVIHDLADDFSREIHRLCATKVTPRQWEEFLDRAVPLSDAQTSPRAMTAVIRKRQILGDLYTRDIRVAPWTGTAHGVLQALNTYEHHLHVVRGATRPERNMLRTVTGDFGKLDRQTLGVLQEVLVS